MFFFNIVPLIMEFIRAIWPSYLVCGGSDFFLLQERPLLSRPVQHRLSKGVKDGRRPPARWAGHPQMGVLAVSGVARPQGVEGLGIVAPGETLGSP
jgi:hypothetical protein